MSGIVFLNTRDLEVVKSFYISEIGMTLWMDQRDCIILKHGNLLLGFCERDSVDACGIITFFYDTRAEVDACYGRFRERATSEPRHHPDYPIYNFFAADPEGRTVEFQQFVDPVDPYLDGVELLLTRRSVRHFKEDAVPDELVLRLVEASRWAPSAHNTQPAGFVVVRDRKKLELLAALRGSSSAPLGRAPLAVAVSADPAKSQRHEQDACIAAYHFLLAAAAHGLGTCWMAALDRDDVKDALGIPREHTVATVTPLGWPSERPAAPERRPASSFVRFIADSS